jgi:hypothetical protein
MVASRLVGLLGRYRPELVDGTIYGGPSLVWPGAKGHAYFVAVKPGKKQVSLYLIIADRYPEDLAVASSALRAQGPGDVLLSGLERREGVRTRRPAGSVDRPVPSAEHAWPRRAVTAASRCRLWVYPVGSSRFLAASGAC